MSKLPAQQHRRSSPTGQRMKKRLFQMAGSIHCAVLASKLWPTVTHYDAGKANMRTYLLQDCTAELAKAHGVRQEYPEFSLEYIQSTVRENIGPEFLQLT